MDYGPGAMIFYSVFNGLRVPLEALSAPDAGQEGTVANGTGRVEGCG
jgi:hypothetical protein